MDSDSPDAIDRHPHHYLQQALRFDPYTIVMQPQPNPTKDGRDDGRTRRRTDEATDGRDDGRTTMGGRVAFYYFRQQKPRYHLLFAFESLFYRVLLQGVGGRQHMGTGPGQGRTEHTAAGFSFSFSVVLGRMNAVAWTMPGPNVDGRWMGKRGGPYGDLAPSVLFVTAWVTGCVAGRLAASGAWLDFRGGGGC